MGLMLGASLESHLQTTREGGGEGKEERGGEKRGEGRRGRRRGGRREGMEGREVGKKGRRG